MKALVLTGVGQLELREVEMTAPAGDEIILDVAACGVCGTDLHMYHGDKGAFDNHFPLVRGHEFSGVVSAVGPEVRALKPGDRVCVDPNLYCGSCRECLRGKPHFCERMIGYGTTLDGGFARQCKVRERAAYRIPDSLSFVHAAMVEPVACCMHGIDRAGIEAGGTAVVIGAGPIGLMMLQLALCRGAARVAVVEPVESRRELARQLGAFLAADPGDAAAMEEVRAFRADSVIECVGKPETMEQAVELAGKGATVMLFGLPQPGAELRLLPYEQIFQKEVTITGSFINPQVSERVIRLLDSGRINLDAIITDRVPLNRAAEVFADSRCRSRGKTVILPGEEGRL